MSITFRQLKIFEAVSRHLSFTRAAAELHLSQPAVSIQIKQLEETVGVALFEQLGKRIFLTEAGREFRRYAHAINLQLGEARQIMDEFKGVRRGHLNISVSTTAAYFTPPLLGGFVKRFPGIAVSMDVVNRETLLEQLESNEIDMAIMGQPSEAMDVVAEAFMDNPLVLIAPPDHPLAAAKDIAPSHLAQEAFVLREPGSGTRIAAERYFAKRGIHLNAVMEMSSQEAIKQAVRAGLGLAIVSAHTVRLELEMGRLVLLDVQTLPIQRHYYLVHREGKRLSAVAQHFKDFVLTEAHALLEAAPGT